MKKILQGLVVFLLNQKGFSKSFKISGDFSEADYYCQPDFEMSLSVFQRLVGDYFKSGYKSFEETVAEKPLIICRLDADVSICLLENDRLMITLPYLGHLVMTKH